MKKSIGLAMAGIGFGVAAIVCAQALLAATPAATSPAATAPAADAAPVQRELDQSTPAAAFRAFRQAMIDADPQAMEQVLTGDPVQVNLFRAIARLEHESRAWRQAGKEVLNADLSDLAPNKNFGDLSRFPVAEESNAHEVLLFVGDNAYYRADPELPAFKRMDGKWRIVVERFHLEEEVSNLAKTVAMLNAHADLIQQTTADIRAGKYQTREQMEEVYGPQVIRNMLRVGMGTYTPSTQPASTQTASGTASHPDR